MKDYDKAFEIFKALLAGLGGQNVHYPTIAKSAYEAAGAFDDESARRWEERQTPAPAEEA